MTKLGLYKIVYTATLKFPGKCVDLGGMRSPCTRQSRDRHPAEGPVYGRQTQEGASRDAALSGSGAGNAGLLDLP